MVDDIESGGLSDGGQQSIKSRLAVERIEAVYRDVEKQTKDEVQLAYFEALFDRLDDFGDLEATSDLKIRRVEGDIWELDVRAFVLHDNCFAICFAHIPDRNEIIVLGVVKKDFEGQKLKRHHIIKMRNRLLYYLARLVD